MATASHSFWKALRRPGMLLLERGRGLGRGAAWRERRSSAERSIWVMGQRPVAWMYLRITERSNMWPVFVETTGSSRGWLERAQWVIDIIYCL